MRDRRRPLVLGLVIAVIAVGAVGLSLAARPSIPDGAATAARTRTAVTGDVAPDPTKGPDGELPPIDVPLTTPAGGECLPRIQGGAAWLDLCWSVNRVASEVDPQKDYYLLRLTGSHEGARWVVVRSQLVGSPAAGGAYDVWPDGTYDGPCRREPVNLMVALAPLTADELCGGTEAHPELGPSGHRLTWTCQACLVADAQTRGLSLYSVVAVTPGSSPSWDVFADLGT